MESYNAHISNGLNTDKSVQKNCCIALKDNIYIYKHKAYEISWGAGNIIKVCFKSNFPRKHHR